MRDGGEAESTARGRCESEIMSPTNSSTPISCADDFFLSGTVVELLWFAIGEKWRKLRISY